MTHRTFVLHIQPFSKTQAVEVMIALGYFGPIKGFITNAANVIELL